MKMTRRSTLFLDLEKELEELRMNVDSDSWMEGIPPENIKKFLGSLSNISDERHQSYITYSVQEILFICFFAVLSNSNTWTEIGEFAVRKRKWLGCFFDTSQGVPSHDTIQRTMTLIKSEELHTLKKEEQKR